MNSSFETDQLIIGLLCVIVVLIVVIVTNYLESKKRGY